MTEELKQKAEEYLKAQCLKRKDCLVLEMSDHYITDVKQAYIDGATENGIQWHDLRKDPNDLPKDNCMVLVRFEKPAMKFSYFCHSEKKFSAWNKEYGCNVQLHNVIAWCEIPQFNSEE